ncbi:hypothetical protein EZV62_019565 [Acer yangbiense]|uniref:60S ribosomal protein L27 n=1 Tax=Acer yangbiense TaxID=1000413 RepID=A0A5C7HBS5_9ROSI|nr:hypothetical protein EZV62_019565 [Acer yangbiense]
MGGYIVDCVDINKQPSVDHPLLKNHKVQAVNLATLFRVCLNKPQASLYGQLPIGGRDQFDSKFLIYQWENPAQVTTHKFLQTNSTVAVTIITVVIAKATMIVSLRHMALSILCGNCNGYFDIWHGLLGGRKAVIIKSFDDGTRERPYGHYLVAGIKRYPNKVIRKDNTKKTAKKSRVKAFIKLVKCQHLMPTRYTLDVDLKDIVTADSLQSKDKKVISSKETKKRFEERFKTGNNS